MFHTRAEPRSVNLILSSAIKAQSVSKREASHTLVFSLSFSLDRSSDVWRHLGLSVFIRLLQFEKSPLVSDEELPSYFLPTIGFCKPLDRCMNVKHSTTKYNVGLLLCLSVDPGNFQIRTGAHQLRSRLMARS